MAKLIRKRSTTILISDWKSPYGLFAENKRHVKLECILNTNKTKNKIVLERQKQLYIKMIHLEKSGCPFLAIS